MFKSNRNLMASGRVSEFYWTTSYRVNKENGNNIECHLEDTEMYEKINLVQSSDTKNIFLHTVNISIHTRS